MPKKKATQSADDLFPTSVLPTHIFRAGDVGQILGIEKWRLEKFLTGKQYRLTPSGHLGQGRKPWRIFSHKDLYRLAIANRMVEDGFTAKFVSMVLQEIEDHELLEVNQRGDRTAPDVCLVRTQKGPQVGLLRAHMKPEPYYVLRLGELIRSVDERILDDRKGTEVNER